MATLSRFKAAHRLSAAPGVPSRRSRSGTAALEELVLPVFELPLLILPVPGAPVLGAPCTADGVTRAALDWRPHTASSSTAALHMRMPTALPVSRRRPATARPPDERRSSAQATSPEITPSLQESRRTYPAIQGYPLPPADQSSPSSRNTPTCLSAAPCPRLAFGVMIQKFCRPTTDNSR